MPRFFAPDIAKTMTLPEEESKHCVRVLRLVEGDEIEAFDGKGNIYRCRITLAHQHHCGVEILNTIHEPVHWKGSIVIAIAPTKNLDRLEWAVEKCVEMGVDRIIPVLCQHSERKVLKTERLQKIVLSAAKQSLKATLPQFDELTPISDVIAMPFEGKRFVAYCDISLPREQRRNLVKELNGRVDTLVLIGPEGDFSPEEVESALNSGFVPVTLGESRLRTETAAVMACAACHCADMKD